MKSVSLLLALVLLFGLLTGCSTDTPTPNDPDPTTGTTLSSTTSSSTTTTQTETTTTTTPPEEEKEPEPSENEIAVNAFFTALKDKDVATVNKYIDSEEAANYLVDAVDVTDYQIIPNDGNEVWDEDVFYVIFQVERSTFDRMPAGENRWIAFYSGWPGLKLCPAWIEPDAHFSIGSYYRWSPAYFCYTVSKDFEVFETVRDFSKFSHDRLIANDYEITTQYCWNLEFHGKPVPYLLHPLADVQKYVEDAFGIKDLDLTKGEHYDAQANALIHEGRGGDYYFVTPVSVTRKGNRFTVELCYYADRAYIVEGITMRYELLETETGYRMLSCKLLKDNGYELACGAM